MPHLDSDCLESLIIPLMTRNSSMQLTLKSVCCLPVIIAKQGSLCCQLRCCYRYPLHLLPGRLLDPWLCRPPHMRQQAQTDFLQALACAHMVSALCLPILVPVH